MAQGSFNAQAQAEVYGRAMADAIGFPNEQRFLRAEMPEEPESMRHVAEEACTT
ncbi:hypothetical protein VB738_13455 [Cyanobium gracile UHCC 0139]|uniref:Uncharacterized protein n=1 Tax=Cyanobium gracile UHCC 0139 TaxID=3110308 RepID=A0ABU5RWU6_9CYAN|nr:hypothetical protein [Cyanobium gracile]MEA5392264.1 hypothetical protein [Cyanobium gracile UHCC 0139]